MSLTLAQFKQRLAAPELPSVTLLAGAEHLLVQEAADALRARARELGYSERDVLDADARFDWDKLKQAGASMSLFATRRVIDLRLPSGRPGKEGSAAIRQWCQSPPPDTTLLISAQEWSKAHQTAWVNAVDKAGCFVPLWPLKPDESRAWVAARLRARGIAADADAANLLVERTEGNLLAAAQEIDKLVIIHGEGKLDAPTLGELVADSARFDVFKLADAAFAGDSVRALRVVDGLRGEGEDVLRMLGWVQRQIEVALRLAGARDFAAQARTEHLWPARQQLFRKALRRGDAAHWQRCLQRAARIDAIVKGRAVGDAEREFERLVVMIAEPRAAQVLA